MNRGKKTILPLLLLTVFVVSIPAQTTNANNGAFLSADAPQWAKDIRRWEIVAFGSIPFTMFTATFGMDMRRWNEANGLDFSDEGRRYAPWPLKSAGAELMNRQDQEMVFLVAGTMSIAVAFADMIIVQIKRYKARKRAEAIPIGTTIITRTPLYEELSDDQSGAAPDENP